MKFFCCISLACLLVIGVNASSKNHEHGVRGSHKKILHQRGLMGGGKSTSSTGKSTNAKKLKIVKNPMERLDICQGPCDQVGCEPGLICQNRNGDEPVLGDDCMGEETTGIDFCVDRCLLVACPTEPPTISPSELPTEYEPPKIMKVKKNPDGPLDLCEGPCDEVGCNTGLICQLREKGEEEVLGCDGTDTKGVDYCVDECELIACT